MDNSQETSLYDVNNTIKPKETKESLAVIDDEACTGFVYNNSPKVVSDILHSYAIIDDILSNSILDDVIIKNQPFPGVMLYEFYQHNQRKDTGRCFGVGIYVNGTIVYIENGFIRERVIFTLDHDDYTFMVYKRWAEQLMKRYDELSSVKQQ